MKVQAIASVTFLLGALVSAGLLFAYYHLYHVKHKQRREPNTCTQSKSNWTERMVDKMTVHTHKTHVLGPSPTSPTTVVSAFFSFMANEGNMGNMLVNVHDPLVMFTDRSTFDYIKYARNHFRFEATLHVYEDFAKLVQEFNIVNKQALDPSAISDKRRIYDALRVYMLNRVVGENRYASDYFIYTDAQAWRDYDVTMQHWPNGTFVRNELMNATGDHLLLGRLSNNVPANKETKACNSSEKLIDEKFMSGTAEAIKNFNTAYYTEVYKTISRTHIAEGLFLVVFSCFRQFIIIPIYISETANIECIFLQSTH